MLHLHYSNHLEALLEPLARGFARRDPFAAAKIAVPNRNLEEWLRLRLAEQEGIAVHLQFEKLDTLLRRILAPEGARHLDDRLGCLMLMGLLSDACEGNSPLFAPVRQYLKGEGDGELRLFQLADRLMSLFRDYAFQRSALVEAWERGRDLLDHPHEPWQARLWRDLYGPQGLLARLNRARPDRPFVPLHQIALPRPGAAFHFETIHLFGISYVSRFHQRLIERLAEFGTIHLYVLNPCREFWADVPGKRKMLHEPGGEGDFAGMEENPFLQSWGRPGREYFKLMNELGDWDYQDHFVDPTENGERQLLDHALQATDEFPEYEEEWEIQEEGAAAEIGHYGRASTGASLLQWIQSLILHRLPLPSQAQPIANDGSLEVLGCAGPRREAEAVASRIWAEVEANPRLSFRDIAVIVTRMDTYQLELENAFSRCHNLPYNLVDGCFGGVAQLAEALVWLLEFPQSRAERSTLFQFFQHPNVQARFPHADMGLWLDFCERLGVFAARDKQEQRAMGMDYLDRALYHWEQALLRMSIGEYFHLDDQGSFSLGGAIYPIEPFSESEAEEARAFALVLRSLFSDTTAMAKAKLSAAEWARFLRSLVETYMAPLEQEQRGFQRLLELCSNLRELGDGFLDPDTAIPFARIRPLIRAELKQLSPHFGYYLMEGVTISSFLPMRPIPFKVVFVMGLNSTLFPAQTHRDTLDLRHVSPKNATGANGFRPNREPGDVSETERDRYMFLETLISTREKLVLTYSDRDPRTMDLLPVSSLVDELLSWARALAPKLEIQHEPLKAYSEDYKFPFLAEQVAKPERRKINYDPEAHRLAAARRNYARALRLHSPELGDVRNLKLKTRLDPGSFPDSLRRAFGLNPAIRPKAEPQAVVEINLRDLRRFLECPLQSAVERLFGLRGQEPEKAERSVEPFGVDHLMRKQILGTVFEAALCAWNGELRDLPRDQLGERLRHAIRQAADAGKVPAGPLERPLLEYAGGVISSWMEQLTEAGFVGPFQRVSLGRRRSVPGSVALDPLIFPPGEVLPDRSVRLTGETHLLGKMGEDLASLHLSTGKNISVHSRALLRGFLDGWVLAAIGRAARCKALLVPAQGKRQGTGFQHGDPAAARASLAVLLRQMCLPRHDYLLPFEVVAAAHRQHADTFDQGLVQQLKLKLESPDQLASATGQVRNWRDFPLPNDAMSLVEARYGSFFQQMLGDGEPGDSR